MGCEVLVPDDLPLGPVTLGSDSRLAAMESLSPELFAPPTALDDAFEGCRGLRLVTATPTAFERGWLPDGLTLHASEYRGTLGPLDGEVVLRSAFVQRPVHVSGWDMVDNAPKATSRMVPGGSVYFFERTDGRNFTPNDARALWLAAVGDRTDEGFGRVVAGPWHPRGG
jgi:CRISPR-associated protein Cmr3